MKSIVSSQTCLIASAALSSLIASCASNIPNPTGTETTQLDLVALRSGYGEGTNFSRVDCDRKGNPSGFEKSPKVPLKNFMFGNNGPDPIQVPVGAPIYMSAIFNTSGRISSSASGDGSMSLSIKGCEVYFSFVPEAGHKYLLQGNGCSFGLVDASTNRAPTSLHQLARETICPAGTTYSQSFTAPN